MLQFMDEQLDLFHHCHLMEVVFMCTHLRRFVTMRRESAGEIVGCIVVVVCEGEREQYLKAVLT